MSEMTTQEQIRFEEAKESGSWTKYKILWHLQEIMKLLDKLEERKNGK